VWVKPDWAFLEEGMSVPSNPADRVESGILGDYALGFGKGYFIHGTLYTRLLGKNVTHGCIRLRDDDLKTVYKLAKVGTPLIIF
jgi:L,D-transpeptidase ErfK/SrfK